MRRIRLLDKTGERECPLTAFDRLTLGDVAIAALGPLGGDTEGDQEACARGYRSALDRGAERIGVGDRVIGWHHQHLPVRLALDDAQRSDASGRRGVATDRLEQ